MTRSIHSFALTALVAVVLALAASPALADREVCLRYPVQTVDSGLGVGYEDYYAENDQVWPYWKARGAAYEVLHPDTFDLIQDGYASNVNGCFTIPEASMPASDTVVVVFYLDSLLHGHARVRTREGTPMNCADDEPFGDHAGQGVFCQPLVCLGETYALSDTGQNYIDYFCPIPEVTLQALAAFPTYWWHHYDPASLDYDFTATVRHVDGCAGGSTSCSNAGYMPGADDLEILVNIDDQVAHKHRQKFLVGHEIGHAVELAYQTARHGTMQYLYGGYTLAEDPACPDGTELHTLTSLEHVSDAIMEGFAHFLSADAYNDHGETTGRFTYYKDYLGYPRDIALEGEPAFDAVEPHRSNRYAERVCSVVAANTGTELDWLRFFWDLHTVGGGADGEHENLLQLRVDAAFQGIAWNAQNGYHLIESNACSGPPGAQYFQADYLTFAGSDDGVGGNGVEPTGAVPSCP